MPSQSLPVLVVGAGPTGLVHALTLCQSGVPVRIIDKAPKPFVGSRGAGIQPRTLEVYNSLGVLPDILTGAVPMPINRIYKLPGGTEVMKDFRMCPRSYPTPGIPFFNSYMLGQDVAQSILRSHLEKYGCHVEHGTELRTLDQHADRVEAQIVKHEDGNESPETFSASYVVGADGARGAVRKLLGLSFEGQSTGVGVIIADVKVRGLEREHWHMWGNMSTQGCSALPRYTHDDETFWIICFGKEIEEKTASDPEAVKALVKKLTDRPDIEITDFLTLNYVNFNVRMVSEFSRGRVFVAGDAAHVHSAAGGQGMNSSVMDAFNLAWKISLAYKGLASPNLLQSYTDERKPVIQKMLKVTTETLEKTVRMDDSGWERGMNFYQLDVNYRGSPIVVDHREVDALKPPPTNVYTISFVGTVQAGDRAPDAPNLLSLKRTDSGSALTSLFRIFKPTKHTVMVLSASGSAAEPVVDLLRDAKYPSDVVQTAFILPGWVAARESDALPRTDFVLKDTDGHVYEGYSVDPRKEEVTVIIVRPDGMVGGIGNGAATVKEYFERVFA
ncbi:monooxygenase [Heliocybe sulcata]|uniref:Monooxygenase n=1 Tax=Heliocybe sulcata TaxID=5364 RepID=A0A5C3MR69_9AGAM|nr:monooxygenase [Heliocybe sulcata]